MEDLKIVIGRRIKESRKLQNLTQKQVADLLHMTQQQYSRFENGIYELDYKNLIEISKLFNVSLDYLFGLKEI